MLGVSSGDTFSRMRFPVDGCNWHRKHIGQFNLCKEVFQPSKSWSFEGTKAISLSPVALAMGCWHLAQFNWHLDTTVFPAASSFFPLVCWWFTVGYGST